MKFGPTEITIIAKALREFLENDPKPEEGERAREILLEIDLLSHY